MLWRDVAHIFLLLLIDVLLDYIVCVVPSFLPISQGLTNDKTQISSVDSVSYAKRFVKFMKDNTV